MKKQNESFKLNALTGVVSPTCTGLEIYTDFFCIPLELPNSINP